MDEFEMPEADELRPRELPKMVINRNTYYVDSRLRELRNVLNPRDRIVFDR